MSDPFDAPTEVQRDRWGRPLVHPPEGSGKPEGYTRCTTFVDALEDTYNLTQWEKRMVAIGLSERADLLLAVAAHRDDKKKLNEVANAAKEAAKASSAATTGTALHALTERVDRGEPLPALPETAQRDIDAYRRATVDLNSVAIEQFCVYDPFRIGGTPDRVVEYRGQLYIADVKTGSIDFGAMKIAMQLGVYSRSTPYDFRTHTRGQWPRDIDQDRGIVIHLPAGTGRCELRWIDISKGWDAVLVAKAVRDWRGEKDWYEPFEQAAIEAAATDWAAMVAEATAVEQLRDIWAAADLAGAYTDELDALCKARKQELESAA
ncbi:PD-(D/E)XK nuclease family protein [Saccharopolyspora sp. WRP15-2]|uniref:PD-(D/E)XK nuclease family protein n=1 Tax=Saccharopolyspora oryzae TaxID=2997343 RepID=A0ABT4URX4_9PSEU|nr:PD-(D/E)XK nuclease family protein [Saccharopolyspora oryzae]MDA3624288.1 PD-(D/E)XK nuclease family protein [Saccharopolyspora oryzae]